MTLLESLRDFPSFATVPDEQLQWFIDRAEEQTFPEGHIIYKPNDPVDFLMLLIEGRIRIDAGSGAAGDELALYDSQAILGVLPFSRMKSIPNRMMTEKSTRVLMLHRDHLRELAQTCYELTSALVQQMTTRVRDFTRH